MSDSNRIDDGGPVYPVVYYTENRGDELLHERTGDGLTIRDYFAAHAPKDLIDSLTGSSVGDVTRFLGLPDDAGYRMSVHYPMAEAKARYIYADAMLKARAGQ